MPGNFTPAVSRALQAAQTWARRLGAPAVDSEHLLHGLLDEEEGRAAGLLAQAGLDLPAVRRQWLERAAAAAPPANETPLPVGAKVLEALEHGRQLAGDVSADGTLASEQLLLAVLRADMPLRRELEQLGLSFDRLETEVLSAHGAPPLRLEEPLRLSEAVEEIDTARILDAAANRAREALRVLEDYCRFVLDDAFLSGELKRLRHELAACLSGLPAGWLLEARETLRDVGTGLSTPGEEQRHSLPAVAQANLKRLQEALRSLEEFGKVQSPSLGKDLEKLRYQSYTVERAIMLGAAARRRLADARLCVLVSGALCAAALDWTIREAAAGGADVIQLREKNLPDRALLERAQQVRRWTRQAGVLFIMNDRPDLARLAEADGVHLGQADLPIKEARRILGPDALIGVSTHDIDQVRQAVLQGASYIGVGPTFPSDTKEFPGLAGLELVRQVAAATSLPAFVIGGVSVDTIAAAVAAGARRIAVSQAICQADDPRRAAQELRRHLGDPPRLPSLKLGEGGESLALGR